MSDGPVTAQEFLQVKNALVASEAKIQQLLKVNVNLSDELRIMQKKVAREGSWAGRECFAEHVLSQSHMGGGELGR